MCNVQNVLHFKLQWSWVRFFFKSLKRDSGFKNNGFWFKDQKFWLLNREYVLALRTRCLKVCLLYGYKWVICLLSINEMIVLYLCLICLFCFLVALVSGLFTQSIIHSKQYFYEISFYKYSLTYQWPQPWSNTYDDCYCGAISITFW